MLATRVGEQKGGRLETEWANQVFFGLLERRLPSELPK
jgi:hypothetical protein